MCTVLRILDPVVRPHPTPSHPTPATVALSAQRMPPPLVRAGGGQLAHLHQRYKDKQIRFISKCAGFMGVFVSYLFDRTSRMVSAEKAMTKKVVWLFIGRSPNPFGQTRRGGGAVITLHTSRGQTCVIISESTYLYLIYSSSLFIRDQPRNHWLIAQNHPIPTLPSAYVTVPILHARGKIATPRGKTAG